MYLQYTTIIRHHTGLALTNNWLQITTKQNAHIQITNLCEAETPSNPSMPKGLLWIWYIRNRQRWLKIILYFYLIKSLVELKLAWKEKQHFTGDIIYVCVPLKTHL